MSEDDPEVAADAARVETVYPCGEHVHSLPRAVNELERVEGVLRGLAERVQRLESERREPVPPPTAAKPERSLPQPIGHVMQFFKFEHLPAHLREVSQPFGELASWLVLHCPHNPELTVALRKLLESKDAAVRAVIAG
jgi:hypothetical protein